MPPETFADVYRTWKEPVFGYFYNALGEADEANDLVSETFLRAWRAWGRFVPRYEVKVWLFNIARHLLIDHHRRQQATHAARVTVPLEDTEDYWDGEWPDIEGSLDQRVVFSAAWSCLSKHQRAALSLTAQGYGEIDGGAELRISRGAFRGAVFRGRDKLARKLRRYERLHSR
jgi:RNA polymerase sigma-70 factor, ECF subfamily